MMTNREKIRIKLDFQGATHVGKVRSANQDSFHCDGKNQIFIVADGMGGHAGGEIASHLAVTGIAAYIGEQLPTLLKAGISHPDARIASTLADAVNHASTKIYERALEEPGLKGMGTTATVVKVIDDWAYCAHVGDSRLYLMRSGFIYQITNDHSLVSEQVRAGLITKEEAELHHLRNVITRSVGYQEEEDVDTASIRLEDNDYLLLCSDGLHGKVNDKELCQLTNEAGTKAVDRFINLANERGGDDNISVVMVHSQVLS